MLETETNQPAVLERPAPPEALELTGKHLEAAFTFRAAHHKQRILEKFGESEHLPPLPNGSLDIRVSESEKRFQKAYDLLRREQPAKLPPFNGELSRNYVIAVADNLAWKGIENSIITSHLDEIKKVTRQIAANGTSSHQSSVELKARARELKVLALEDNHFYRDFFDSGLAKQLEINSSTVIRKFLKKSSLTSNNDESADQLANGISLEIATARYIADLIAEKESAAVNFGSSEEDQEGGDIVVIQNHKILYIDLKKAPPPVIGEDEIEQGYRFYADKSKGIYKAVVWAESREAVASDSFRLADPKLKNSLGRILGSIS